MTNDRAWMAGDSTDLRLATVLSVDPRLAEAWQFLWERWNEHRDGCSKQNVAIALRLAYLQGYADANGESEPGGLYRDIGAEVALTRNRRGAHPPRRAKAPPDSSGM